MALREAAGLFQPQSPAEGLTALFQGRAARRGHLEDAEPAQLPGERHSQQRRMAPGQLHDHRPPGHGASRARDVSRKGVQRIGATQRWATLAPGVYGRPVQEDAQRARQAQPDEPRISMSICSNWTLSRPSLPTGAGQLARTRHGAGRGAPTGYRRRPTRTGSPRSPPGRGRWGNRPRPGPSDDTL